MTSHPSQESEMRSDDPVEVDYSFLNDDRPYLPDRGKSPCGFDHAVIREQAATEVRRELLAKVEGLPTSATVWTGEPLVRRALVLALFEEADHDRAEEPR